MYLPTITDEPGGRGELYLATTSYKQVIIIKTYIIFIFPFLSRRLFFSTFSYDTIFFFKWSKSNSHPTSLNYHSRFLSWNLYYDNSLNNHIFVWIALFQKKKDIVYKQMTISDIWKFFDNQWFFYFHLTNFIYTYIFIYYLYIHINKHHIFIHIYIYKKYI